MRITYLELENIKSYGRRTRIELTSGLNAVCGHNGSGKSTLLEAIGFALFDYLPYPQAAFMREGERNGAVRLGLLGRDGREYEIVRKVGGTYSVFDGETSTLLATRGPDVLAWIRQQALDIEEGTDLEALFKNAVGVPQGLMTSDFGRPPTFRKNIFDPLLRVEEYRRAFDELKDTTNYLRDRNTNVEAEIRALQSQTDTIPDKREEVRLCTEKRRECGERLDALTAQLTLLGDRVGLMDAAESRVRALENDARGARYEVDRAEAELGHRKAALDGAREARAIVVQSEGGYKLVQSARQRLVELEERRTARDDVKASLAEAVRLRQGVLGSIQSLERQLIEANESATAAALLHGKVTQQEELERQRNEAALLVRDGPRLDAGIAQLRTQIERLDASARARAEEIDRARVPEGETERLPAAQAELQTVSTRIGELVQLETQRTDVSSEGKALKEERTHLLKEAEKRRELAARLEALAPIVSGLDALLQSQIDARGRQAKAQAQVEFGDLFRADLYRNQCPLLDIQCPAVTSDRTVLQRFEKYGADSAAVVSEVSASLAALEPRIAATQGAKDEAQTIDREIARLDGNAAALEGIEKRLRDCIDRHRELSVQLEEVPRLGERRTQLEGEIRSLQERAQAAARLPLLIEQGDRDEESRQQAEADLLGLQGQRAAVQVEEERVVHLDKALGALGDPKRQQQELLALGARKPQIEESVRIEHERQVEHAGRVKALTAELQTFETLHSQIEEQRQIEDENGPSAERYLQYRVEAATVEEKEKAVAEVEATHAAASAELLRVAGELDTARSEYDAEEHAQLKREYVEGGIAVERETTTRTFLQKELDGLEAELRRLERLAEKLRGQETERDELRGVARAVTFIRETIKAAGPAVTDALLVSISEGANDIYAEIMDDHAVELRWDRDYEILVQRGTETRKFMQLSGGEQMSAALAVRLALLKEMSEVDFAFFDEPTQNMDGERRMNLAAQIRQIRGFDQLIIISHDDTFEHDTDNLIRLHKQHEETTLEAV